MKPERNGRKVYDLTEEQIFIFSEALDAMDEAAHNYLRVTAMIEQAVARLAARTAKMRALIEAEIGDE